MELVKTAKRLKKEKINVDLISFGECEFNQVTSFLIGFGFVARKVSKRCLNSYLGGGNGAHSTI